MLPDFSERVDRRACSETEGLPLGSKPTDDKGGNVICGIFSSEDLEPYVEDAMVLSFDFFELVEDLDESDAL